MTVPACAAATGCGGVVLIAGATFTGALAGVAVGVIEEATPRQHPGGFRETRTGNSRLRRMSALAGGAPSPQFQGAASM